MNRFLAELKRRHVARVALVYVAVGFAVLQAADLILPRLGLPEWTVTFVIVLTLLGLPIALVLAWAFELTPDGVRRTLPATAPEATTMSTRWIGVRTVTVATIALMLAVAAGWFAGRAGTSARVAADAAKSIAVLPFDDMSEEKNQEYFSDGMTEEILNTLTNVPGLRVAARTSAFAFKGTDRDIREIGRTLGVAYVLEGSVRKQGNAVLITAQLIEAENGFHVWSDKYEGGLDNVFELQEQIARQIADALSVPLGIEAASHLVEHRTDTTTYELYLQARALFNVRGSSLAGAIQKLRAAVQRDSSYVPALATLAEALAVAPYYLDVPWERGFADAEAVARRTIALEPSSAAARTALANILRDRWQWDAAEREYLAAIAADSTYPEAYQNYGEFLGYVGRLKEAVSIGRRAVELDPLAPVNRWEYARRLLQIDSLAAAETQYRETIRLVPANWAPRFNLMIVLARLRRFDDAEKELDALGNSSADYELETIRIALRALRGVGSRDDALRRLQSDQNLAPRAGPPVSYLGEEAYARVLLIALLGGAESALSLLEKLSASAARWGPTYALWTSELAPVRNSPRMRALVHAVGLNPDGLPAR